MAGRMLTRTSGGVTTTFTWDGMDMIRESTPTSTTTYLIPEGQLLGFVRDGATYCVSSDAIGSCRIVTDSTGTVKARFDHGAFGELLATSFVSVPGGMPYSWVGSLGVRTDATTGLVYMRQRWYDPQLQRFISRDPIGLRGGTNAYLYVANSPTNLVDPQGLSPLGLLAGAGGALLDAGAIGAFGLGVAVAGAAYGTGVVIGKVATGELPYDPMSMSVPDNAAGRAAAVRRRMDQLRSEARSEDTNEPEVPRPSPSSSGRPWEGPAPTPRPPKCEPRKRSKPSCFEHFQQCRRQVGTDWVRNNTPIELRDWRWLRCTDWYILCLADLGPWA
eukprot:TRINITY_DN17860_c0_g1_i1.p1 TRINITY_DN17860_c0_g1~~TRINITY_DN17860_c0_g1_i1.p1  ORF type:complete len:367 (-),score=0.12 TRINITY_DN17860_c0_g1_i1:56-1048(-)